MKGSTKRDIYAIATLVGTAIGVGIYAMPWAYSKHTISSFVVLIIAWSIMNILYRLYIRLITDKRIGNHQLPGITERILSKKLKNWVAVPLLAARSGVLFLYITVLGNFTNAVIQNIFSVNLNPAIPALLLFFVGSIFIRKKFKSIGKINLYLSIILVLIITVISLTRLSNYTINHDIQIVQFLQNETHSIKSNFWHHIHNLALTYGVTIGAMSGIGAIPSLEIIVEDRKRLNQISLIGSSITVIVYAIFILFILSSTNNVSQDALSNFTDSVYILPLLTAGILSVMTSFVVVGRSLFEIYTFDYDFSDNIGWGLTIGVPLIMYLVGIMNFASVVGFIGGLVSGIEGLLIIANYFKLMQLNDILTKKKKILLILFGIVMALGTFFAL